MFWIRVRYLYLRAWVRLSGRALGNHLWVPSLPCVPTSVTQRLSRPLLAWEFLTCHQQGLPCVVSRPQPVSTPRQGATNLDFKSIVTVTVTSPRLPPYHPFKVECKVDFFLKHIKLFLGVFGDKVPVRKLINYSFVSTPKLVTAHSKALVLAIQHCLQCPDERQQTLGFVWSIYSLVEQMAVSDGMGAGGRRHLPEESWMLKGSEWGSLCRVCGCNKYDLFLELSAK